MCPTPSPIAEIIEFNRLSVRQAAFACVTSQSESNEASDMRSLG